MEILEIENVDEVREIIESISLFYRKAPSFIMILVTFKGFSLYLANIIFVLILIPASWFVVKNSRAPPVNPQIPMNEIPAITQLSNFPNYNMMNHQNPQPPPQYHEFNQLPYNPQLIIAQKDLMIATEQR